MFQIYGRNLDELLCDTIYIFMYSHQDMTSETKTKDS